MRARVWIPAVCSIVALSGVGFVALRGHAQAASPARVAICLADVTATPKAPVMVQVSQGKKILVVAEYAFAGTWTSAPIGDVSGPVTVTANGEVIKSDLIVKPGAVAVMASGQCPEFTDYAKGVAG